MRAIRFGCFIYIRSDCLLLFCWAFVVLCFWFLFVVLMFFVVQEEAVFCSVPFSLPTILDYRTQSRA